MIDLVEQPRIFLFLQGMANPFFGRLAKALTQRGHRTYRVNFNGGDRLFWGLPNGVDFRGRPGDWPGFFEKRLIQWKVTDLILFGDRRPMHRIAVRSARARGVVVHVFEEGYFRPHWITHELNGVNGNSALPRNLAWYLHEIRGLPPTSGNVVVRSSFFRRSVEDVLYNLASLALTWRYPHYRTHRPWLFYVEYASWLRQRILKAPVRAWRHRRSLRNMARKPGRYFVFPLQVDSDYQIRDHSADGRMRPVVERTIASFAAHAPPDAVLIVKDHPLDNGLTDWRSVVERCAANLGICERVIHLAGGNLERLLRGSSGVVTVNSTVGAFALTIGIPVIALGQAIYGLAGLTFQGSLDDFWRQALAPDPEAVDAFRRVVMHHTQINGGFYGAAALRLAVAGAIAKLEGNRRPDCAQIAYRAATRGAATHSVPMPVG